MRLKTRRTAVYAAMGLTVLALTGGFALANIQLGQSNTTQQGSQSTVITSVSGLSWTSTSLVVLEANVVNSSCGNPLSPCSVMGSPVTDCVGGLAGSTGCQIGDFVEQVVLTTTANTPLTAPVHITLYVEILGAVYPGATFYYTDSAGNPAQTITQDFDIGNATNGPAFVSEVTVIATA